MSIKQAAGPEPKVKVTEKARDLVLRTQADEFDPDRVALWVELVEDPDPKNRFSMYFRPVDDARAGDSVQEHDGIVIVIPQSSAEKLRGGPTLYLTGPIVECGLGLVDDEGDYEALNVVPTSPAVGTARGPLPDLGGDVPQRIIQVLEGQINPAIAVHGGRADLVAVEEGTAYLRLSGGCQGCGLATVTLSQGIEVAIKNAAPEISKVVDVTDHASGTNPFFEPSKK